MSKLPSHFTQYDEFFEVKKESSESPTNIITPKSVAETVERWAEDARDSDVITIIKRKDEKK
jgi:hypothetical protein